MEEDDYLEAFPFYPKPMNDISYSDEGIETNISLLIIQNLATESVKEENSKMLLKFATNYLEQEKSAMKVTKFFTADGKGGKINDIRKSLNLPSYVVKHQHPMVESTQGAWFCDGCSKSGIDCKTRYRCAEECDFDYCEECIAKADLPVDEKDQEPIMVILNILDLSGYFPRDELKKVNEDNLVQFIEDYSNNRLKKIQFTDLDSDEEYEDDDEE